MKRLLVNRPLHAPKILKPILKSHRGSQKGWLQDLTPLSSLSLSHHHFFRWSSAHSLAHGSHLSTPRNVQAFCEYLERVNVPSTQISKGNAPHSWIWFLFFWTSLSISVPWCFLLLFFFLKNLLSCNLIPTSSLSLLFIPERFRVDPIHSSRRFLRDCLFKPLQVKDQISERSKEEGFKDEQGLLEGGWRARRRGG